MTPAVSVIIPTFNYAHFLPSALESALAQTMGDLEVIVVDDGSTDATVDVVRPYVKDPRVRFEQMSHGGVSRAKNTAIVLSRASLVAFLDADDQWLPQKLERQLAIFRTDPDVAVVYSRRLLINEYDQELVYEQPSLYRGHILERLFLDNFVCQTSAVVRRSVLDEVGCFDERCPPVEDYDLWLRIALRHRFDYVDEPLVRYRVGHASLTQRTENKLLIALEIMDRFVKERGGNRVLSPAVRRRAWAETYFHFSLAKRPRSRLAALYYNVKALAVSPGYWPAWKSLAALPIPEAGRRWLRRTLGRSADWSARQTVANRPLPS
jgi:glycosyltransferase involved in cell wall biosynthesis